MSEETRVAFDEERCKACELCVQVCPKGIVELADRINSRGFRPARVKDQEQCTRCTFCARICPDTVIEVYGRPRGRDKEVKASG